MKAFVLGPPRSGTTLLRLILNSHSRVFAPDELIFFSDSVFPEGTAKWRESEIPPGTLDRFTAHLARRLPGIVEGELRTCISGLPDRKPRTVFLGVMDWLRDRAGKTCWVEKTPGHLFFADVLSEMFPDARFLMLHRDPRAVVASMNRTSFCSCDTVVNTLNLRHYLTWFEKAEKVIPGCRRRHIRYEDLLSDPESEVRGVCEFLDLPYEHEMLDFHADAGRHMQSTAAQDFNRRATERLDAMNAERWKSTFPEQEKQVVERLLGDQLVKFGYQSSAASTNFATSTRLLEAAKGLYWRFNRMRFGGRRDYQQRESPFFRTRMRFWRFAKSAGFSLRQPSDGRGVPNR